MFHTKQNPDGEIREPEPETLSDERVRNIINDVLTELYYSKQK